MEGRPRQSPACLEKCASHRPPEQEEKGSGALARVPRGRHYPYGLERTYFSTNFIDDISLSYAESKTLRLRRKVKHFFVTSLEVCQVVLELECSVLF
ncbi:hypothetical protein J6590_073215 [Homalodisca vitripennis]|nr:hypothetical protein J6590_073215 [Homalodisca vitripennis]